MGTPLHGMTTGVGHPETPRRECGGHNCPPCPLLSHLLCPTGGSSRACRQPGGMLCTSRTRWGHRPGRRQGGGDTGHTGSGGGQGWRGPQWGQNRAQGGQRGVGNGGASLGRCGGNDPSPLSQGTTKPHGCPSGDSGQGFRGLCGCPPSLHSLSHLCALAEGQTLLLTL